MRADNAAPGATRVGRFGDLIAIVVCTLAWGTTWYAITLQLGVVDPVVSIVYRFALAAALLFAWGALRGEALMLTRAQHLAALGVGLFTFCINYAFVYWAEERVSSAVVAVLFASLAFVNLIGFRIAFGVRASPLAWGAALLGVIGVGVLSWDEIAGAELSALARAGVGLTLVAIIGSALGNIFARRGELAGSSVIASTAWAMAYGVGILAAFAVLTGKTWAFEWSWTYVLSLAHLALIGSVLAFVLYFNLARRRGYATASYISALTPPVAMIISMLFEGKSWGLLGLVGVALALAGQVLLLRAKRKG